MIFCPTNVIDQPD